MTKIFTSIAPKNFDRQKPAINSWIRLGFDVYSVNTSDYEIDYVQQVFPDVKTILKRPIIRGKFYVEINHILDEIFKTGETCWIINSDIILNITQSEIEEINDLAKYTLVFGSRIDIDYDDSKEVYKYGFDYFILNNNLNHLFTSRTEFCMGQTWWDYWMPITCIRKRVTPIYYQKDIAIHHKHEQNWTQESNEYYAAHLAKEIGMKNFNRASLEQFTKQCWEIINEGSKSYS